MTNVLDGVDMTQILPTSVAAPLQHQVAAQMPALLVTWMAPMLAVRDHAIKTLQWLHAELLWKHDQTRASAMADAEELAALRVQVEAVGRGMARLLDEVAEARTVAGLDGAS